MEAPKAFLPNEIKTLEIDVEKKIFNINGVPFGEATSECSIVFDAHKCSVRVEMATKIIFKTYERNFCDEKYAERGETVVLSRQNT